MTNRDNRKMPISRAQITAALAPYGVPLSETKIAAIETYTGLLLDWNRVMNLTALEDPLAIAVRHFGESFFGASELSMTSGRLADVGSGAGFPGLAIKISVPEMSITLIESNHKKCAFLAEVTSRLGLVGVEIMRRPYEECPIAPKSLDFVCSRALGNYRQLLRWARNVLVPGGRAVLWLGTDDSVIVGNTKGWCWDIPKPIPESQRRVILSGFPR